MAPRPLESGPPTRSPSPVGSILAPMAARQRRSAAVSSLWRGRTISTGAPVSAARISARFVALFDGGTRSVPESERAGGTARKSVMAAR